MEARELRIGNLVYELFRGEKQIREFNFTLYECHDINLQTYWDEALNTDILKELEPIPLTEEWLVRFGIHIEGQSISLKSGTIGVIQRGREGMFKYYLQSAFGMVHLDYIKHVHQLQNLYFALTGEELELKE